MKIQSIEACQQTSLNFGNAKIKNALKIKPGFEKDFTQSPEEKNYLHAIMLGLAFILTALTKSVIDITKTKHYEPTKVETTIQIDDKNQNTLITE